MSVETERYLFLLLQQQPSFPVVFSQSITKPAYCEWGMVWVGSAQGVYLSLWLQLTWCHLMTLETKTKRKYWACAFLRELYLTSHVAFSGNLQRNLYSKDGADQRRNSKSSPSEPQLFTLRCGRLVLDKDIKWSQRGGPFLLNSRACRPSCRPRACWAPTLWAVSVAVMSIWAYLVEPFPVETTKHNFSCEPLPKTWLSSQVFCHWPEVTQNGKEKKSLLVKN